MPITGEVDISGILANLGDPGHGLVPARPSQSLEDKDEPYRAAYGTIDMSTSMELKPVPKIIWDVNHYYRSLGIEAPYTPTRRELRQAFQRVEGHASARTTYYLKQLLDPEIRQEYDSMPLGSRYRDRYVIEEDMKKLSDLAQQVSEAEGKLVTVDDLVREHEQNKPPELPPIASTHIWNWGFYAFKSRVYDTEPLEEWQLLLAQAFTERKVAETISIGYIGGTRKKYVIKRHDDRNVFFLNDQVKPTIELAKSAVSQFIAHRERYK